MRRWASGGDRRARGGTGLAARRVGVAARRAGPGSGARPGPGGFVLSYDMVWVPDLALRPDFLGLGSALPRAVPSDAVVAVLDEVVPGCCCRSCVLLGALVGGGLGAARLVARVRLAGAAGGGRPLWHVEPVRGRAAGDRSLAGAGRVRRAAVGRAAAAALAPRRVGAAPAAGAGAAGLPQRRGGPGDRGGAARRRPRRGRAGGACSGLLVAAATRPWVVAGLLHAGVGDLDPAGAAVFALHGEGPLPGPLAALALGGIWNAEVVPSPAPAPSAGSLCVAGARPRAGRLRGRRLRGDGAACATGGLLVCVGRRAGWLAVLTWVAPDAVGWLAAHGARRRPAPRRCAAARAVRAAAGGAGRPTASTGSGRSVGRGRRRALGPAPVALAGCSCWCRWRCCPTPPGASAGGCGPSTTRRRGRARAAVTLAQRAPDGDVLVLPLSSYRQPGVERTTARCSTPRPLPDAATTSPATSSSSAAPRWRGRTRASRDVASRAGAADAEARAAGPWPREGIGVVAVDRDGTGSTPEVAGEPAPRGRPDAPSVVVLQDPTDVAGPTVGRWPRWASPGCCARARSSSACSAW